MAELTLDVTTEVWDGTCDECGGKPAKNRACYKPEHQSLRRHMLSPENPCIAGAMLCDSCRKKFAPTLEDRVERIETLLERLVEAREGGGLRAAGAIPSGVDSGVLAIADALRRGSWPSQ